MGALPIHLLTLLLWNVSFSHNAQHHRQMDRQTDIIMPNFYHQ